MEDGQFLAELEAMIKKRQRGFAGVNAAQKGLCVAMRLDMDIQAAVDVCNLNKLQTETESTVEAAHTYIWFGMA